MGIPTHIKQQNSNNNIKKITFDMCAPPRFCTQLWALQRYFCLFVILSGLESTTLKPIYWFWASGDGRFSTKAPYIRAYPYKYGRLSNPGCGQLFFCVLKVSLRALIWEMLQLVLTILTLFVLSTGVWVGIMNMIIGYVGILIGLLVF